MRPAKSAELRISRRVLGDDRAANDAGASRGAVGLDAADDDAGAGLGAEMERQLGCEVLGNHAYPWRLHAAVRTIWLDELRARGPRGSRSRCPAPAR